MKEASKIIMGATLVMVVSLAVVLALILVLLAELYCSLLLRSHRKNSAAAIPTTTAAAATNQPSSASPLSSIYSHGVLRAPPNMLHNQYLSFSQSSPDQSPVLAPLQIQIQLSPSSSTTDDQKNIGSLMYISNPIFDKIGAAETPFETPETSPSRLESGGSSSSGEENQSDSPILVTAPVKKLREEACSVSLRDAAATSLGTSVTDSNSRNVDSSSSSVSSATSTSW